MNISKILVIGKRGQLAFSLSRYLPKESTVFLSSEELDLRETSQIQKIILSHNPSLVICAAAYTQVDLAESHKEEAMLVNAVAMGEIAKACAHLSIPLIHFSTDYIFDGQSSAPYLESSVPCPKNIYGVSKLAGEEAIVEHHDQYLIFRVTWLYSYYGKNFLNTMFRLGLERDELKIVNDQVGAPTFVDDISQAILKIVNGNVPSWGIYNLTNQGFCTWYDFACRIFVELRSREIPLKVQKVLPITSSEYPTPASRPQYSVLDNKKFKDQFGFTLRSWDEALVDCIDEKIKYESSLEG